MNAEGLARAPTLTQRADGLLGAERPVGLPIMAPRLQGEASPEGWLDLALWGAGDLGRVRFSPLAGPYIYGPNRFTGAAGGVHVAQSAPVLVVRGAELRGLYPARRRASWDRRGDGRAQVNGRRLEAPSSWNGVSSASSRAARTW